MNEQAITQVGLTDEELDLWESLLPEDAPGLGAIECQVSTLRRIFWLLRTMRDENHAALNASHGAAGELAALRAAYRAAYEVGGRLAALVWSQDHGFPIAVGHVGKILMEWQTLAAPAASPTAPDGESGLRAENERLRAALDSEIHSATDLLALIHEHGSGELIAMADEAVGGEGRNEL